MFFDPARIGAFREMICAETVEERETALAKIEPMQQADFEGLFEALGGHPVTIRFLDPPLHEFVPRKRQTLRRWPMPRARAWPISSRSLAISTSLTP